MSDGATRLLRTLGCSFNDERLLQQALTHRSAGSPNNERLEFLGDALLGFVIAEALWRLYPEADEGELSRLRAALVKQDSLAALARNLSLGDYLRLGAGEMRTGGHSRDSILADATEALFAAVYLDQGFAGARSLILALFEPSIAAQRQTGSTKDPKTRLQELLQASRLPLPDYRVLAVEGDAHNQRFTVSCALRDGSHATQGTGTSRRRAEQQAAQQMLEYLKSHASRRKPDERSTP